MAKKKGLWALAEKRGMIDLPFLILTLLLVFIGPCHAAVCKLCPRLF